MTFDEILQVGSLVAGLGGAGWLGTLLTRWLDARAADRKKLREEEEAQSATLATRADSHMDRLERLLRESQDREAALLRERERDQARMALLMDHLTDVHRYIAAGSKGEPPDWPTPLTTGV